MKTKRKNGSVTWRCSVRNKNTSCKATVLQKGTSFTRGCQPHVHPGKLGAAKAAIIQKEVKKIAGKEIFTSASEVVNRVLLTEGIQNATEPLEAQRKPDNLARAANRFRQKMRPAEPQDLNFEIDENYIPEDFLRKDVHVDGTRHLLFATEKMLDLLSCSKTWYVDATFKAVKEPFTKLFRVHSFIRSGDDMKQVPLLFVLMSGRRKKDYKKVLKSITHLMPDMKVQKFIMDFERAVWKAVPLVFPNVHIRGCAFHWAQFIW